MTSVKETLDSLSIEEQRRLTYAFEHGLAQHVEMSDGKFIGVNIESKSFPHLLLEQVVGVWATGTICR